MSGPIVRSGPSPEFSKNWDKVFGGGKSEAAPSGSSAKKGAAKAEPAAAKKAAKKAPVKKVAKKAAKKAKK